MVYRSLLHAKQLLIKLLFESLQTYANLLLGLMPANFIFTRCVKPCWPDFKLVGISVQKPVDSQLDKTRPVTLKTWSYPNFKEHDLIKKLRASTLQADRRKLTASVLVRWWVLLSLQYCVWSNGLLLPLLFLSRHQLWQWEKRTRWIETKLFTGVRLHYHRNVGMWVVETSQGNH